MQVIRRHSIFGNAYEVSAFGKKYETSANGQLWFSESLKAVPWATSVALSSIVRLHEKLGHVIKVRSDIEDVLDQYPKQRVLIAKALAKDRRA